MTNRRLRPLRASSAHGLAWVASLLSVFGSVAGDDLQLEDRVRGALWGLFAGDALAMPVHWYYGGPNQIARDFGSALRGYEKAVHPYPESIMQVSNTGGAGRGGNEGDVIGSVILHGKKDYWRPGGKHHYHHTLEAGENTLEASLVRVLMKSIVDGGGTFSADRFRDEYIKFMTTPGTHNDAYASTCHRMFFAKWHSGVDPKECPDNDEHNVDTIDSLVLPTVVVLAELAAGASAEVAAQTAIQALEVTRRTTRAQEYVRATTQLLAWVFAGTRLKEASKQLSKAIYNSDLEMEVSVAYRMADPVVACYIEGSFPALLAFGFKYGEATVDDALLASANAGGENVHRGAVFGVLVGAQAGVKAVPEWLRDGLVAKSELQQEIDSFVQQIMRRRKPISDETEPKSEL